MYFIRGRLPWQGIAGEDKNEKYTKIMEKKKATPVSELCKGFPGKKAAHWYGDNPFSFRGVREIYDLCEKTGI